MPGGGNTLTGCGDAYTNRTFTVTGGHISFYGGTHTQDATYSGTLGTLINLMPYDTTSNPGGVYILAICAVPSSPTTGTGAPGAVASICKYDAFKVKESEPPPPPGKIQSCFSGIKYRDDNKSGNFTGGETLLPNWVIDISDGTNNYTATTDDSGFWSWCEPEHDSADGTTTYTFTEELQTGWKQTGNTVDEGIYSSNVASHDLDSFVYSVEVPNDESASADNLDFGNIPRATCSAAKYYDTNHERAVGLRRAAHLRLEDPSKAPPRSTPASSFTDDNNFAANFTRDPRPGQLHLRRGALRQRLGADGQHRQPDLQDRRRNGVPGPAKVQYLPVTIPNDQPSSVSKIYFGNVCLADAGRPHAGLLVEQNGQARRTPRRRLHGTPTRLNLHA